MPPGNPASYTPPQAPKPPVAEPQVPMASQAQPVQQPRPMGQASPAPQGMPFNLQDWLARFPQLAQLLQRFNAPTPTNGMQPQFTPGQPMLPGMARPQGNVLGF